MTSPSSQRVRQLAVALAPRQTLSPHEQAMKLLVKYPELRVQLFRFIESFPALESNDEIARHLYEYLDHPATPEWLRRSVELASRFGLGRTVASRTAGLAIEFMGRNFIAGTDGRDAVPLLRRFWSKGVGTIVDALGEKIVSDSEAEHYLGRVVDIVEHAGTESADWEPQPHLAVDHHGELPRVAVAIKSTALAPGFAPLNEAVAIPKAQRRVDVIIRAAEQRSVGVWFDVEQYSTLQLTTGLFEYAVERGAAVDLGIVVQAYLVDSRERLQRLLAWAATLDRPVGIRLVKGAYWDYETVIAKAHGWPVPVYEDKRATDANFIACASLMLEAADIIRPAFASHNLRSLAWVIAAAEARGLPPNAIEVQTLFGMAPQLPLALRDLGYRSRVYAPIGELIPGMSYLVRRLLENTSNESFLRQQLAAPLADLLAEEVTV